MSVVRIPREDAERALKVAIAAASRDDITPVLVAVHWRVEEDRVVLTGTDRYRVHEATVRGLDTEDTGEFLMHLKQARWLVTQKHLPLRDHPDQYVEVEWFEIEGRPVITSRVVASEFGGAPTFSYTTDGVKGNFPPVGRLFPTEQDKDAERAPFVGLNPEYLGSLKVMQSHRSEPVKIWSPKRQNRLGPVVIEATGGNARAMIQPNLLIN